MKKLINKKNLLILGVLFIVVIIILSPSITAPKTTTTIPITPAVTPSSVEVQTDINQTETTVQWNKIFAQQLADFEKNQNKKAEKTLSDIRLNSPVNVSGNTIIYDYKTATYTITILSPYLDNQNKVLSWLNQQGVDQNIIKTLRFKWVQQK